MQKSLRILTLLFITTALIIIFHSLFLVNANLVKELQVKFETGKKIGIDVNNTALTFGIVPPGSTSTRELILTNTINKDLKIILKAEGPTKDFISFQENNFLLKSSETKKIFVYTTAPLTDENKIYTGIVKIYSFKP